MAWWARLLLAGSALLLSTGVFLMLPLRIFICYLRENKIDQLNLRVKLGFIVLARPGPRMQHRSRGLPGLRFLGEFLAVRRQAGPLLKRVTWSRFDLEISWGGSDPALTALAAGACWSLLGALAGLLQEYFTVKAQPRFLVEPRFREAGLRVRWEGEASISLYRWLRLRQLFKKIGGADSGTSSH